MIATTTASPLQPASAAFLIVTDDSQVCANPSTSVILVIKDLIVSLMEADLEQRSEAICTLLYSIENECLTVPTIVSIKLNGATRYVER